MQSIKLTDNNKTKLSFICFADYTKGKYLNDIHKKQSAKY
jgi:hypothetical protein